jgi:hypothetical protein
VTPAELAGFHHRWDVFVTWAYAGGAVLVLGYVGYLISLSQRLKRQAAEEVDHGQ